MPAARRVEGFRQAVGELGLDLPDQFVQNGDFFMDSGYACGKRLAKLPKSRRPTAVFVAGDEMALGAMHAFADAGLDVPTDIAVVGFDDIEAAGLVRPTLTTVAQDSPALAAAAVTALLTFVNNAAGDVPAPERPLFTPTRLVIRQSCGGGL